MDFAVRASVASPHLLWRAVVRHVSFLGELPRKGHGIAAGHSDDGASVCLVQNAKGWCHASVRFFRVRGMALLGVVGRWHRRQYLDALAEWPFGMQLLCGLTAGIADSHAGTEGFLSSYDITFSCVCPQRALNSGTSTPY